MRPDIDRAGKETLTILDMLFSSRVIKLSMMTSSSSSVMSSVIFGPRCIGGWGSGMVSCTEVGADVSATVPSGRSMAPDGGAVFCLLRALCAIMALTSPSPSSLPLYEAWRKVAVADMTGDSGAPSGTD